MRVLLKYPTRGRADLFLRTLRGWLDRVASPTRVGVLVSVDADDGETLALARGLEGERFAVECSPPRTKVEACNAGLAGAAWDVVLLVSDDMRCTLDGWDDYVRAKMAKHWPDTDGALWFPDGRQAKFNTIECVGRRRFDRFGYLYHPAYASFYCDNEATEVGIRDGRLARLDVGVCVHEHPGHGGNCAWDATYIRAAAAGKHDARTFERRRYRGFPV